MGALFFILHRVLERVLVVRVLQSPCQLSLPNLLLRESVAQVRCRNGLFLAHLRRSLLV